LVAPARIGRDSVLHTLRMMWRAVAGIGDRWIEFSTNKVAPPAATGFPRRIDRECGGNE
jgi:hypothetical protein